MAQELNEEWQRLDELRDKVDAWAHKKRKSREEELETLYKKMRKIGSLPGKRFVRCFHDLSFIVSIPPDSGRFRPQEASHRAQRHRKPPNQIFCGLCTAIFGRSQAERGRGRVQPNPPLRRLPGVSRWEGE